MSKSTSVSTDSIPRVLFIRNRTLLLPSNAMYTHWIGISQYTKSRYQNQYQEGKLVSELL